MQERFHFSSSYSGDWNVTAQSNWLTVSPHSGNGSVNFMVFSLEHTGTAPREGTVTVQTGAETVTINVTQLDPVSGYFNQINSSRTSCTARSSNEYNHPLATWAMQLSYAAYNPAEDDEAFQILNIPSSLMQYPYSERSYDSKAILDNCDFQCVIKRNYGSQDTAAAHVVGYRQVTIGRDENSMHELELNGGNNTNGIRNRIIVDAHPAILGEPYRVHNCSTATIWNNSLREYQSNELDSRPLLVIAVRGSVSWADWLMDVGTQFTNHGWQTFYDGSNAVYQTLYGTGEANNCPEWTLGLYP